MKRSGEGTSLFRFVTTFHLILKVLALIRRVAIVASACLLGNSTVLFHSLAYLQLLRFIGSEVLISWMSYIRPEFLQNIVTEKDLLKVLAEEGIPIATL
eukprot:766316-Hanusia_phi.AAC.3